MAMSFKHWRPITVNGLPYRWRVQNKPIYRGADTFQRLVVIRSAAYPQSKCMYVSDEMGYFWLWTNYHALVVTPKSIAACIDYALQHGWNPQEKTEDYSAVLSKDLLSELFGVEPTG